jgi:MFS family permease
MPITVTEAIMAVLTGLIIHRTGRYLELIYFGVALLIIGNGLFTLLSPTSSVAEIICFQIIAGIGGGPLFQTPLIALQADISQDDTATATATFGFVRNMANSLSVIIAGVLFQNSMNVRVASLAEPPVNLPSGIVEMLSGGAAAANVMLANTIEDPMHKSAVRDAYSWSVRNIWILYTCLAALAVVASLFIKKHHLREEHVETKTGLKKKEGESVK